ncbi:MAG: adenosylcobinamide-phosphate synthase CbiB [Desulfosarcinaceae bacterium]|nr:adenosylcobinamide-phosphate synthase CbiB [Desulfosarcinaceae bacterium]
MNAALILLAAILLDFMAGDPRWLPHPIRWMGLAIKSGESAFRRLPLPPAISGAVLAVGLILGSAAAAWGSVFLAAAVHPWLGSLVELLLLFYCLSTRSLADAATAVWRALANDDMGAARRAVSLIVGRETAGLTAAGVARAAVETVAENLVDGVIAPLFWAAIGGAPLAMAYKMANTLDSMMGYKNKRYRLFGRAAARIDDLVNWAPARLSPPLISLAAALLAKRGRQAWATARRDGRRHSSPNAGWPEAAFAGGLGVWLGGPSRYHGEWVAKPTIGEGNRSVAAKDIPRACDLMWLTALMAAAGAIGVRGLVG